AYELLTQTDIVSIVIERDRQYVGGISRTVNYEGNRIDIGGHRFFSKSEHIMHWWSDMLPVSIREVNGQNITYHRTTRALTDGLRRANAEDGDAVMHVRPRKTRILYGGNLFAYPVELSFDTLRKLGILKVLKIILTYGYAVIFPIRPQKTLEDFFLNRFGRELYETFFKSYTEKVWGMTCKEMSADWGAQRVKGLSIIKAIMHATRKIAKIGPLAGKGVETSLIEQFLYPTFGPGQMWEVVADKVCRLGGELRLNSEVIKLHCDGSPNMRAVTIRKPDGSTEIVPANYVFSTAAVRDVVRMIEPIPCEKVRAVADNLRYRDFITVGLLLNEKPKENDGSPLGDTWMYIQEKDVRVGRVQLFHNWHPSLVADPNHGWLGLEYFCTEGDDLWKMQDSDLLRLGTNELEKIGLLRGTNVLGGTVIRQVKAYPGYFGSYDQF